MPRRPPGGGVGSRGVSTGEARNGGRGRGRRGAGNAILGITFGARNFEDAWATWWKLGTWVITLAFGAANVPYTMKHLRDSDDDAAKGESEASA